jgi:hypothetical protein
MKDIMRAIVNLLPPPRFLLNSGYIRPNIKKRSRASRASRAGRAGVSGNKMKARCSKLSKRACDGTMR